MGTDCGTCKYRDKNAWGEPWYNCGRCYDGEKVKGTKYEPMAGENDSVSHPNHYQSKSGLETIDVIKAFTEDCEGIEAYYAGNVIKYVCRWKKKNGLEDLKKARQYLDWLIEKVGEKEPPKNGRYSMDEVPDCFVPWQIKPYPVYPAPGPCSCCMSDEISSRIDPKTRKDTDDAVAIIWDEFCNAFLKALNEVSEEEKEKKDEE